MVTTSTSADTVPLRIMERMLQEGFASGRTAVADELCSPDLLEHQFGLTGTGREAIEKIKKGMESVHTAFPDLRLTVEDSAQAGDTIWVRAEGTGTNTGPFLGPPTGLPVRFTVIDIARIVDGRIVEHWGVPDRFAIMLRLGMVDVPAAG